MCADINPLYANFELILIFNRNSEHAQDIIPEQCNSITSPERPTVLYATHIGHAYLVTKTCIFAASLNPG